MLGIGMPYELRGIDERANCPDEALSPELMPADALASSPGDTITHVNGEPVEGRRQGRRLLEARSAPCRVPAASPSRSPMKGERRPVAHRADLPLFQRSFGKDSFDSVDFAGMIPRTAVYMLWRRSPARGKLCPATCIIEVRYPNGDVRRNPSAEKLIEWLNNAGKSNQALTFVVERNGEEKTVENIVPSIKLPNKNMGLGMQLRPDGTAR
jgi:hypothetical protein